MKPRTLSSDLDPIIGIRNGCFLGALMYAVAVLMFVAF
jgi:hypothetical protein